MALPRRLCLLTLRLDLEKLRNWAGCNVGWRASRCSHYSTGDRGQVKRRKALDAAKRQRFADCSQDDVQVEQHRLVANVIEVIFELNQRINIVRTIVIAHLRPA